MGVNSCGTTLIDNGTFKNIGAITWDTTAKTSGFTAVSGNGYFVNTTSGSITATLPSSPSAGDVVGIADYANTADTNKIIIGRNGSNIQGVAANFDIITEGLSIILVYVDGTQGWLSIDAAQASDIVSPQYVTATGGTITTSGDFKIHTFTSPGTFCVSNAGNPVGSTSVDYMVVAGGGGGSNSYAGGGGGGGGFRLSNGYSLPSPTTSPLANPTGITASVQGYPVTVGGGGSGCNPGSNSVFSTITSTGGGQGASGAPSGPNAAGGSGGGGRGVTIGKTAGSGNTPPVSPPQGQNGGAGDDTPSGRETGGGGGGAGAVGTAGTGSGPGGNGGNGSFVSPSLAGCNGTPGPVGSTRYFSGGGGGSGSFAVPVPSYGTGGAGGGGDANPRTAGGTNTGGGGAGGGYTPECGASGGSGIVMIRYKFQ